MLILQKICLLSCIRYSGLLRKQMQKKYFRKTYVFIYIGFKKKEFFGILKCFSAKIFCSSMRVREADLIPPRRIWPTSAIWQWNNLVWNHSIFTDEENNFHEQWKISAYWHSQFINIFVLKQKSFVIFRTFVIFRHPRHSIILKCT